MANQSKRAADGIRTHDPKLGKLWAGGAGHKCWGCALLGRPCSLHEWRPGRERVPGVCHACALLRRKCSKHRRAA